MTHCLYCGMPLIDDKCHGCFPQTTAPSRECLIRQAILNYAARETTTGNPISYLKSYISLLDKNEFLADGSFIRRPIAHEFLRLESQYQ